MKKTGFHSALKSLQKCLAYSQPMPNIEGCSADELQFLTDLELDDQSIGQFMSRNAELSFNCIADEEPEANWLEPEVINPYFPTRGKSEIFTISSIGFLYSEVRDNFLKLFDQKVVEHEYAAVANSLLPRLSATQQALVEDRYEKLWLDGSVYRVQDACPDEIRSVYSLWGHKSDDLSELIGFFVKNSEGVIYEFCALTFLVKPNLVGPFE